MLTNQSMAVSFSASILIELGTVLVISAISEIRFCLCDNCHMKIFIFICIQIATILNIRYGTVSIKIPSFFFCKLSVSPHFTHLNNEILIVALILI